MMMRKPTKAEVIAQLKVEMRNRQESLERIVKKAETTGTLTKDEMELAQEHVAWIEKNKTIVKNFYRPATVGA